MINNKTLIANGFVLRYKTCDTYGHSITTKRWYYGPYLYLEKGNVGYKLTSILDNNSRYEQFFDTDNIDDIIAYCKDWYMDLNKKLIRQLEEIQDKREEIMNYVF